MAESTPPSRSRLDDESPRSVDEDRAPSSADSSRSGATRESSRRPLRLIDPSMRASQPSLSDPLRRSEPGAPSEPRPIAGRPGADAANDRPARVQLIAALLLLLVLVVVPLYLWRRPRAAATDEAKNAAAALASAQAAETPTAPVVDPKVHTKDGVTVGEAKVLACHDPGAKRTAATSCDRLPSLEAALSKAVLDASSCVPPGTPAGAIAFRVDASYARHKNAMRVQHGRDGTTMPPKVVSACVADVKKALSATTLDQAHGHMRYEIELDATYAGKH